MTDQPKDGGPAFPFSPNDHSTARMTSNGMSLRDWFAGQALAGLCAYNESAEPKVYAITAYCLADAMLEARK